MKEETEPLGDPVRAGSTTEVREELVFRFDAPHQVGTICGFPCEQCGPEEQGLFGIGGVRLPDTPFLILAEATEEDWRQSVQRNGGHPVHLDNKSFYFVRPD